MIAAVDEFMLYDDILDTRRDWRTRNQITTVDGPQWLTVPIQAKGRYLQRIREVEIEGTDWAATYWKSPHLNYCRAAHLTDVADWLEPPASAQQLDTSVWLNRAFIEGVCGYLQIPILIRNSRDYVLAQGKTERLADLYAQAGATAYVSGPAAKDSIEPAVLERAGIDLIWFDYAHHPSYQQLWGDSIHGSRCLTCFSTAAGTQGAT